jgi:hypothetical protein
MMSKFIESKLSLVKQAVSIDKVKQIKSSHMYLGSTTEKIYSIDFYFTDGTKDSWDYSNEPDRNEDFNRIVNGGE